jgi:hypothetical protein
MTRAEEAHAIIRRSGRPRGLIALWLTKQDGVQWEICGDVYHFPDGSKIKDLKKDGFVVVKA